MKRDRSGSVDEESDASKAKKARMPASGDEEADASKAKKALISLSSSDEEDESEHGEEDSDEDEFSNFPDWYETATKDETAEMDKRLNPDPNRLILANLFPCGECNKFTPHSYVIVKVQDAHWEMEYDAVAFPEGPPMLTPRSVQCEVCHAYWNHQVNFGCPPRKRHQLIRLRRIGNGEEPAKTTEIVK